MLNAKECAEKWKKVIQIYEETFPDNNPSITMKKIIEELGLDDTKEVFATVAAIKKKDGRIYGTNRAFMDGIPVNPDAIKWESGNPMISSRLDDIHTTHIDNLITELRKVS